MEKITVRRYTQEDGEKLALLFYETVHTVNAKDYTAVQLEAWAPKRRDQKEWNRSFMAHISYVAVKENVIVGFGDIDDEGYLDRLYVHRDYQRHGVGTALCNVLENAIQTPEILTHASITARPFFEKRGYRTVKEQQVEREGVLLTNFVMKKNRKINNNENLPKSRRIRNYLSAQIRRNKAIQNSQIGCNCVYRKSEQFTLRQPQR